MIGATRPKADDRARPAVYAKGRICRGCGCRLSIYNRKRRCWACRPERRTLAPLDKQPAREQFLDVIREVMEEA